MLARVLQNSSYSNYHSLQVEVRRRFSKGLSFQANYTFSKAFTDSNGSQSTLESFSTLRNLRIDYAPSDLNVTHRFIANFIWELPVGRGRRFLSGTWAPFNKMIEGWTLGGIVNWQTRPPFYIRSNRSTFNSFNAGSNPAQLIGISFDDFKRHTGVFRHPAGIFFVDPSLLDIVTDPATGALVSATLKPDLLGAPDPGTFGNFPRNGLAGPNFTQVDFSLVKRTRITERANIEFRMTMLNAFNHPNFVYSGDNFDDSSFGLITSASSDPRIIHFAIGVNW